MECVWAGSGGAVFTLSRLAFWAVAREGFETTLFLLAGSTNASGAQFVTGGLIGFAIAGGAGVVLYYGAAKLPLKQFFLGSGVPRGRWGGAWQHGGRCVEGPVGRRKPVVGPAGQDRR